MEFHTWYPSFRVAILHDTGSYEGSKVSLLNRIVNANGVIVTTYAGLRLSHQLLLRYQWEYVILDEGHKIRNPDSEITLVCKQVRIIEWTDDFKMDTHIFSSFPLHIVLYSLVLRCKIIFVNFGLCLTTYSLAN